MRLLAIDPGTTESAWVLLDGGLPLACGQEDNAHVLRRLYQEFPGTHPLAIEMPRARGQPAGNDLFDTLVWIGRFTEAWMAKGTPHTVAVPSRQEIVYHLCGVRNVPRADAAIRQILIDRYGPGKDKALGTKKHPGPLYGVKRDIWQALAVGVYALDALHGGPTKGISA